MKTIKLSNGIEMPIIGLGVYKIQGDSGQQAITSAISKYGYRMIDTAQAYLNEDLVGNAIINSNVNRKDIFITTKVWFTNYGYNKTIDSINNSLKKLKTNYIDLVLLHQPYSDYYSAWRALEFLYKNRIIKSIGVSNFEPERLVDLCLNVEVKPMINQVELHPFRQRDEEIKWFNKYNVVTQSWGSLGRTNEKIFENPILLEIAKKHNKTVPQVILGWLTQNNIVVIPKSVTESRLKDNINIFDFNLSGDDINKIKSLNNNETLFNYYPSDAKTTERIFNLFPELK